MRAPVLALALFGVVACGPMGATPAAPGTTSVGSTSGGNTNPSASRAEAAPLSASAYAGLWLFTHDGADWVTLRLAFDPTSATVERWHADSWTRFTVTQVKLAPDGSGLRLDADYDRFDEGITIELHPEDGGLVGTVTGPSYGASPSIVAGRRIAP